MDPFTVARGSRVRRGARRRASGPERWLELRHPGPHGAVLARRRDLVAGDEDGSGDGLRVPREDRARTAGLHLPGAGRPVAARRQDRVLVGTEAGAAHLVPVQRHDRLACARCARSRRGRCRRCWPSTRRRERGLKPTSKMLLLLPASRSVRSRTPDPLQTIASPSAPAVAINNPFGLNAARCTRAGCGSVASNWPSAPMTLAPRLPAMMNLRALRPRRGEAGVRRNRDGCDHVPSRQAADGQRPTAHGERLLPGQPRLSATPRLRRRRGRAFPL